MQLMREGYRNVASATTTTTTTTRAGERAGGDRGTDNLADRFTYNTLMKLCVQVGKVSY